MKILEILILDILRKLDIFGLRYAAYFCQTSRVDMTMSKIPEKNRALTLSQYARTHLESPDGVKWNRPFGKTYFKWRSKITTKEDLDFNLRSKNTENPQSILPSKWEKSNTLQPLKNTLPIQHTFI